MAALGGPTGPVHLQQVAEAMQVPQARIKEGLTLSCQQCKDLLRALNVPFKSNQSRASLLQLVLEFFLDTEDEKQEARQKMDAAMLPTELQDDDGFDYEDLLGLVEENANQGQFVYNFFSSPFLLEAWHCVLIKNLKPKQQP